MENSKKYIIYKVQNSVLSSVRNAGLFSCALPARDSFPCPPFPFCVYNLPISHREACYHSGSYGITVLVVNGPYFIQEQPQSSRVVMRKFGYAKAKQGYKVLSVNEMVKVLHLKKEKNHINHILWLLKSAAYFYS